MFSRAEGEGEYLWKIFSARCALQKTVSRPQFTSKLVHTGARSSFLPCVKAEYFSKDIAMMNLSPQQESLVSDNEVFFLLSFNWKAAASKSYPDGELKRYTKSVVLARLQKQKENYNFRTSTPLIILFSFFLCKQRLSFLYTVCMDKLFCRNEKTRLFGLQIKSGGKLVLLGRRNLNTAQNFFRVDCI